jgi:hypothetical protein
MPSTVDVHFEMALTSSSGDSKAYAPLRRTIRLAFRLSTHAKTEPHITVDYKKADGTHVTTHHVKE